MPSLARGLPTVKSPWSPSSVIGIFFLKEFILASNRATWTITVSKLQYYLSMFSNFSIHNHTMLHSDTCCPCSAFSAGAPPRPGPSPTRRGGGRGGTLFASPPRTPWPPTAEWTGTDPRAILLRLSPLLPSYKGQPTYNVCTGRDGRYI